MVNRLLRDGITTLARAGGFTPTGAHWVERIKHVRGEFRPSTTENALRWFVLGLCVFACALLSFASIRDFRADFPTDAAWFDAMGAVIFLILLVMLVYWPWRRYIFENGSVRCIWANGHEFWREDLAGLQDIICTTSWQSGVTWMKLRWADHSRRVQLYDSLRNVLDSSAAHAKH